MKRVFSIVALLLCVHAGFGQSQFIVGIKGGISGCFYQFNTASTSGLLPPNYLGSASKITSKGPSIPALLELIYGTKKFRVGYQFEYERILTTAYTFKTYNIGYSAVDTTVNNPNITQHFFCHNLLIEYIVWDDHKRFRLVPDLSFGYFHGLSEATEAPYDFSALNQNRFKIGIALNMEYYFGQLAVVATPSYGLVPIKSIYDPNQKGYMHFVGIHIGMRFNTIKQPGQDDGKTTTKKKKKEYVNPEEDN